MRRKNEEIENETEEVEEVEELSEKDAKKKKHKESVEKRKNAKRKDKVARWGGIILLGLIMFVGFLLWVFGEMSFEQKGSSGSVVPTQPQNVMPTQSERSTIIVK